jgi:hypothetical protein
VIVVVLFLAAAAWLSQRRPVAAGPVGLFSSLPIIFSDSPDLGTELRGDVPPVWALGVIGDYSNGTILPLDTLDTSRLHGVRKLVIAQSRALSPQENVALDEWVRGGGRVLVFTDPLLTEPSRYPLGDPRRPQAMAMLSPILARWGLKLEFDEAQTPGERQVDVLGVSMPVEMAGRFKLLGTPDCTLEGDGLLARCKVGAGQVQAFADAQVLARANGGPATRRALGALLKSAFAAR